MSAGLALSGGLDSSAAWWACGKPGWYYATEANPDVASREAAAVHCLGEVAPEFATSGRVIRADFSVFRCPQRQTCPRQLLLAMLGVGLGFTEIQFAIHDWDCVRDSNYHYFDDRLTELLQLCYVDQALRVRNITKGWSRVKLIQRARAAGCPDEFLLATWSCQRREDLHCGSCDNCVERFVALSYFGLARREDFATNPLGAGARDSIVRCYNAGRDDFLALYREFAGVPEGQPIYI